MDISYVFKSPPINLAQRVLRKFKSKHPHRTVRTDQGKELGKSSLFQQMMTLKDFTLELTGVDSLARNGITESPNTSLVNMMRCLFYSANLGPEYWLYALIHATYIKN